MLFAVLSCGLPLHAQAPPKCPPPTGHISIGDGTYSSGPGVTFHLRHFIATLVPQGTTAPLCYAKTTAVSHADIFVSNASLTQVFAQKLEDADSKISDFKVVNEAGRVTLSGNIKKVIPIHFSISGPVSTDGHELSLKADKIKADGLPIKALLDVIGKHLSAVLGLKGVSGVSVRDDTISFSPEKIAHLKGTIVSVESTPQGLALHYGGKAAAARARATTSSPAAP